MQEMKRLSQFSSVILKRYDKKTKRKKERRLKTSKKCTGKIEHGRLKKQN